MQAVGNIAGCGNAGECNLNFNIRSLGVSSNGQANWFHDIYTGQFDQRNLQYKDVLSRHTTGVQVLIGDKSKSLQHSLY